MATCNSLDTRFGLAYLPSAIRIRLGQREIFMSRDCRQRYCPIKPVFNCSTGIEPGYVELVLLRKWLIVFSKAR